MLQIDPANATEIADAKPRTQPLLQGGKGSRVACPPRGKVELPELLWRMLVTTTEGRCAQVDF